MKHQIVVGFPIDINNVVKYKNCTDHQLHEMALENDNVVIYDYPKDFFTEMNEDLVDTENMVWYMIDVE